MGFPIRGCRPPIAAPSIAAMYDKSVRWVGLIDIVCRFATVLARPV
jgi:hypothetical protein